MSSLVSDWTNFRRQPLSAVWQLLLKTFIQLMKGLWPFVLIIFIRGDEKTGLMDLVILFFVVFTLGKSLTEYYFYRFRITNEEIQVRHGIFSKKQTILPLHRIQTFHSNQSWLQKLLKLSEVRFDSPGSDEAEVIIQLDQLEAAKLLSFVTDRKESATVEPSQEQTIFRLNVRDLALLGLTANHFSTLLLLVGLFLSFLSNIREILLDRYDSLIESSTQQLMTGNLLILAGGLVAVVLTSVAVSVIRTSVAYANFELAGNREGYSVSKGLVNTTKQKVPYGKVQYLSWTTNWIRKHFSLYVLHFHTIGNPAMPSKLRVSVPLVSLDPVRKLSETYSPQSLNELKGGLKVHKAYISRKVLFYGLIPMLLLGAPLYYFVGLKAFFIILLPFYRCVYHFQFWKKYLMTFNDELIHIKTGVFGEKYILLKWINVQSVSLEQNLYQQKKQLANFVIHTAGGTIVVPYVPLRAAQDLSNYCLFKIESTEQNWE